MTVLPYSSALYQLLWWKVWSPKIFVADESSPQIWLTLKSKFLILEPCDNIHSLNIMELIDEQISLQLSSLCTDTVNCSNAVEDYDCSLGDGSSSVIATFLISVTSDLLDPRSALSLLQVLCLSWNKSVYWYCIDVYWYVFTMHWYCVDIVLICIDMYLYCIVMYFTVLYHITL